MLFYFSAFDIRPKSFWFLVRLDLRQIIDVAIMYRSQLTFYGLPDCLEISPISLTVGLPDLVKTRCLHRITHFIFVTTQFLLRYVFVSSLRCSAFQNVTVLMYRSVSVGGASIFYTNFC